MSKERFNIKSIKHEKFSLFHIYILLGLYSTEQSNTTTHKLTTLDFKYLDSLGKYGIDWDAVNKEFIIRLNAYRKEDKLDTLVYLEQAFQIAKLQAKFLGTTEFYYSKNQSI